MKLRSLLILAAGVALGMRIASKLREDDPNVLHGPRRSPAVHRPGLGLVSTQVQRLTDVAADKSLEAIRSIRGQIRDRLGEDDVAAWN